MKERPILFKAPMVRAIMAGTKTQTRRIVSPQPTERHWNEARRALGYSSGDIKGKEPYPAVSDGGIGLKVDLINTSTFAHNTIGFCQPNIKCPFGLVGDRLWVREHLKCNGETGEWHYAADDALIQLPDNHPKVLEMISWAHHNEKSYCSPIHMPRWACRMELQILAVGVQRLQDICEEDACAEGSSSHGMGLTVAPGGMLPCIALFRDLWESINGDASWILNPWVWVIEFKRVGP